MKNTARVFGTFLVTAIIFVQAINECTIDDYKTSKKNYKMNCRNLNLTEVPRFYPKLDRPIHEKVCMLDLSLNSFSLLKNGTFLHMINLRISTIRELNLSYSNIRYISTEAFQGLKNLQYLNLSGNSLSYPNGFGKGVFKFLNKLRLLNIKDNKFVTYDGFGREMEYLQNLKGFYAELCLNCTFGKEFEKLKNLKKMSLSGSSTGACNASKLHNYTFEGLTRLKVLWLSSCNITTIEPDAFKPMNKSLTHLDLSYNENLRFLGMNKGLHGLRFSPTLSILNINRIHNMYQQCVKLKVSHLQNLITLRNLTKLFMDLNNIETIAKKVFYPASIFPSSLRVLAIAGNRISFDNHISFIHTATSITCLDISRQHLSYDPFIGKNSEMQVLDKKSGIADDICFTKLKSVQPYPHDKSCSINLPPNLRRLNWKKSFLNFYFDVDIFICGAKKLQFLDLSFNLFTEWRSSIKGLENLKQLDLSKNDCGEISPNFFDHFTDLQKLNLEGNRLGISLGQPLSNRTNRIFKSLKQLSYLDLSHNRIDCFADPDIFKELTNIQHLYLHSNRLSDWNFDLPESQFLRLIDLSQNKLSHFSKQMKNQLNKVCEEGTCNITMVLLNNSFECDCENLPFFYWMLSTKVHIKIDTCLLNSEKKNISTTTDLQSLVDTLTRDICNDKTWITWTVGTVCVVFGGLSSIITALVVYRYRWKLRYIYYRRNRRFKHEGFERLFENDAFVSYAKSNASFIKRYMVPSLEEERGLRLWVADRNSMPGTSIAENISRKAVLLMDKAYLNDSWCNYEMNMAHVESTETKRKMIIIVLMEDIPSNKLPICIMRFLQSERSLEYPKNDQDFDTFWTDLTEQIMN
ncbi:toll-like receptor 4 [Ruditapes philippinarum]|uniref:toll-like receptor 4 n=1 Tax=Ruditapes philippinarum TaxID=129788 RepID=UPI00295ABF97|nr:toll-like receptor 4 [Ruditapes philippinarum]